MTDPTPSQIEKLQRDHADIFKHGVKALEREAAKVERQLHMAAFVDKHGLKCFKCGSGFNDWAKVGTSQYGRAWAICVACVRGKKP